MLTAFLNGPDGIRPIRREEFGPGPTDRLWKAERAGGAENTEAIVGITRAA
jgi:hypothetical protein